MLRTGRQVVIYCWVWVCLFHWWVNLKRSYFKKEIIESTLSTKSWVTAQQSKATGSSSCWDLQRCLGSVSLQFSQRKLLHEKQNYCFSGFGWFWVVWVFFYPGSKLNFSLLKWFFIVYFIQNEVELLVNKKDSCYSRSRVFSWNREVSAFQVREKGRKCHRTILLNIPELFTPHKHCLTESEVDSKAVFLKTNGLK